jgi:hypothetical protein
MRVGALTYGYISAFFALCLLERVWVRVFHTSTFMTRFIAPHAFNHMRRMRQENEDLKKRVAELESEFKSD